MSIYMIRDGIFGDSFEVKLIMALAAILACLYDYTKNKRYDYFWVFLFGTLVWTIVEIVLQVIGTRVYEQAYLLGMELPISFSALLQGTSEGAAVAILGVFIGDRLMNKATRKKAVVIFTAVTGAMVLLSLLNANAEKNIGGDVLSRRDMFTAESILFIAVMSLIAIVWFWRALPYERKRGLYMYLSMAAYAIFWTIGEVFSNTRWIEVGGDGVYQRASLPVEIFALSYDIFIEIALIYVPFLAAPYFLNLIKVSKDNQVES